MCYTEKAAPARHHPECQYNACANRRKQCSPNKIKSHSNPTPPRKRQNNPINGHAKPRHPRLLVHKIAPSRRSTVRTNPLSPAFIQSLSTCSIAKQTRTPAVRWLFGSSMVGLMVSCVLHGECSKRLALPRNTRDWKHLQSAQTTVNLHKSQTKHQALSKGQPRRQLAHNNNQHSSLARLQHSNDPPSFPTPNRATTRPSQPTQPAVKHRRAEPHYNTDTTHLSGDTQRPPARGGPLSVRLSENSPPFLARHTVGTRTQPGGEAQAGRAALHIILWIGPGTRGGCWKGEKGQGKV